MNVGTLSQKMLSEQKCNIKVINTLDVKDEGKDDFRNKKMNITVLLEKWVTLVMTRSSFPLRTASTSPQNPNDSTASKRSRLRQYCIYQISLFLSSSMF